MKEYIKIINIIDNSGSMGLKKDTAISGFNEFIGEQKTVEGDAKVSTILFNSKYSVLYEDVDVKECYELNDDNYRVGGMTALYDSIGKTIDSEIDKLGNTPKEERPSKTLCVILTDGSENSSREYTREVVKEKVEEMKKDFNWEFIFLGADENASFTAETMGISKGNSFSFSNNSRGVSDAYQAVSYASTVYRSHDTTNTDGLMDDYKNQ